MPKKNQNQKLKQIIPEFVFLKQRNVKTKTRLTLFQYIEVMICFRMLILYIIVWNIYSLHVSLILIQGTCEE